MNNINSNAIGLVELFHENSCHYVMGHRIPLYIITSVTIIERGYNLVEVVEVGSSTYGTRCIGFFGRKWRLGPQKQTRLVADKKVRIATQSSVVSKDG